MWTFQSCWHLPNCSGKNEVQGLSPTPPSSITVINKSLLFLTILFLQLYFLVILTGVLLHQLICSFQTTLWCWILRLLKNPCQSSDEHYHQGLCIFNQGAEVILKGSSGQAMSTACLPLGFGGEINFIAVNFCRTSCSCCSRMEELVPQTHSQQKHQNSLILQRLQEQNVPTPCSWTA